MVKDSWIRHIHGWYQTDIPYSGVNAINPPYTFTALSLVTPLIYYDSDQHSEQVMIWARHIHIHPITKEPSQWLLIWYVPHGSLEWPIDEFVYSLVKGCSSDESRDESTKLHTSSWIVWSMRECDGQRMVSSTNSYVVWSNKVPVPSAYQFENLAKGLWSLLHQWLFRCHNVQWLNSPLLNPAQRSSL